MDYDILFYMVFEKIFSKLNNIDMRFFGLF